MILRDELTKFIMDEALGKTLVQKAAVMDSRANGTQFLGSNEVEKIAVGVSCNHAFLEEVVAWGANYCIFHHGLDTDFYNSKFPAHVQKQLKLVVAHDLTVAGFHFSLDAHPSIGNNAVIIQKLGGQIGESLFDDWGFVAKFEQPRSLTDLHQQSQQLFGREITIFKAAQDLISRIGVVSGAGKPGAKEIEELVSKKVDLFVSGETSEWVPNQVVEAGINYFVCGHYATEVFGVKALAEIIRLKFGDSVEIKFIDIPNPI